jgi:hypothetical protein
MSDVLFRVRRESKQAIAKQIRSWKLPRARAEVARDLEEMVQEALADRIADEDFLKRVLHRASGSDLARIDCANEFIQSYCDQSIEVHDLLREMIHKSGRSTELLREVAALDQATEQYRKWQEDYPDLLALAYQPLQLMAERRLQEVLQDESGESDWTALFTDNRKPSRNKQ